MDGRLGVDGWGKVRMSAIVQVSPFFMALHYGESSDSSDINYHLPFTVLPVYSLQGALSSPKGT